MELRLLGPVDVRAGGRVVQVGAARQRCVLAALALDANQGVSTDQLVERVWGGQRLPEQPRKAAQIYISLLRTALAGIDGVAIVRRADGYVLEIDERGVDAHAFRALVAKARATDGVEHAVDLLERALGLWHGEAFGVLDTPWLATIRSSLNQERQEVERDLADLQLRQGRHGMLLARLSKWTQEHPLDERLAGQLMLALFRSGRQADSLQEYRRVRERLVSELGADPGRALQQLYQRILTDDPALALASEAERVSARTRAAAPRQLPAAPGGFTGRARELAWLTATLDEQSDAGRALVISAISGAGGIGKTWLALHWAHQHLDRFPDGQLYVNLRGYDPSGQPVDPGSALSELLGTLGVAPAAIPAGLDAQAALYRSVIADRRMLILLDNALDAAQVAPLLPGTATCTVLVTSRSHLGGLVAAHGARCVEVDVLTEEEARQLLVGYLGPRRVAAEPEAVADLAACCAGLPLALGIVAARAGRRPDFPLAALAAELRDRPGRLDALDAGDPRAAARAVLSWSLHALSGTAVGAFGLIGLAPGPDLGLPAASCLLALPIAATRVLLRELEDASLLQQHALGRYRMHDLIRLYATECADRDRPPSERDAAVRRVTDFYLRSSSGSSSSGKSW